MKIAFVILSTLSAVLLVHGSALSSEYQWAAFKAEYGRVLSDIESRKAAFLAAKESVDQHNREADQGLHTYYKHVNAFSVMDEDERASHFGAISPDSMEHMQVHVSSGVSAPASLDLRNSCMPPIKNQSPCGDCYAFAAVNPMEYQLCRRTGSMLLLSEQQPTDCSIGYGNNNGCKGGFMNYVWDYYKAVGGAQAVSTYPWANQNVSQPCRFNAKNVVVKVDRQVRIQPGLDAVRDMKEALATYGPVPVAVNASPDWTAYKGVGVFSGKCDGQINHAVIVVGYGTLNGVNYWIVRNQWGTGYGLQGYWLMQQGVNQCSIEGFAMYPVIG